MWGNATRERAGTHFQFQVGQLNRIPTLNSQSRNIMRKVKAEKCRLSELDSIDVEFARLSVKQFKFCTYTKLTRFTKEP